MSERAVYTIQTQYLDELGSGTWLIPASDKNTEDEDGSTISFLHSVPEEEEM